MMIESGKYEKVVDYLVEATKKYVTSNNLKCMVLGISGGIDSTLVAYIASKVSKDTGIPLIGRSLRIKNKKDEYDASVLVGNAFCDDFSTVFLGDIYETVSIGFFESIKTPISEGNLMARLRMMYLYNIAGTRGGLVLDTDNLTEHNLGFWTIHGDEGDYNPIGGLWKTEIYEISKWISVADKTLTQEQRKAIETSISLTPTDGNGISNSDLEQIGGKNYYEVDEILISIVKGDIPKGDRFDPEVVSKIHDRYIKSEYKRKTSRTIKIDRNEIFFKINYNIG